jgi:hypothetical protein
VVAVALEHFAVQGAGAGKATTLFMLELRQVAEAM